ncbi:LDLR chaperone boca-like [Haliotis cracherodii]|uniref:LDLR chaperone boca-like n=1 Tax=Haliotis cracherodii TaxID=6455 RepID=UPI0039E980B5
MMKAWRVYLLLSLLLAVAFAAKKTKDEEDDEDDDEEDGKVEDEEEEERKEKAKFKKKNIRDYDEADLERLYDQWEEDEEPLPEDELPEWKRKQKGIDMSQLDMSNPEKMMQQTKKGKSLMMFATVAGNPTEKETEKITGLWHSSMFNANMEMQRYVVGSNRVLFMVSDGAKAWDVKDFLVQQDNCEEVTIDGQNYPGKGAQKKADDGKKGDKKKKKKKDEL